MSKHEYTHDVLSRRARRLDSGRAFSAAVANVFRYNDRSELVSGTPLGAEHWAARVAARLGLGGTLRPHDRPPGEMKEWNVPKLYDLGGCVPSGQPTNSKVLPRNPAGATS
jgi:hypothetical protein